MPDPKQSFIAAIYAADGTIAGTGFAMGKGYVITCAHVVRDALGLGHSSSGRDDTPSQSMQVKFRFIDGHPVFDTVVAPGGWFPGDAQNYDIGALRDIAVLVPSDAAKAFPVGPDLLALCWHGDAICVGFPGDRKGLHRELKGRVAEREETDGWLNFHLAAHDLAKAKIGGMSGSPVLRDGVDGIAAMLSGSWYDDEPFIRIIPSRVISEAVAQVEARKIGGTAGGQLFRSDAKMRAMKSAAKEWMEQDDVVPCAETISGLCDALLDAVRPKANHLPESFPFRYLECRVASLKKLVQRDWPPGPGKVGDFIVNLADFLAVLASSPHDMGAPVSACNEAGQALGSILHRLKPENCSLIWNASDAPWPTGVDAEVRQQVERLQAASEPLIRSTEYEADAKIIDYEADTILDETWRNPPHWTRMSRGASTITEAVDRLNKAGAFPALSGAATGLKQALGAASDASIKGLSPMMRFQEFDFAPEMIVVPPGQFNMGSPGDDGDRLATEGPQHTVAISSAFAIGRYPVTVKEYAEFVRQTGRKKPVADPHFLQHPVVYVTWDDAKEYINWLNCLIGLERYRLLSEAEWEYCCRAGTESRYSFGDEFRMDQANNTDDIAAVGAYPVNDYGLYDMHGNVEEWCEDEWHESYSDKPQHLKNNGGAWSGGGNGARVVRGGSWDIIVPGDLRSAFRYHGLPYLRNVNVGFRVARTL